MGLAFDDAGVVMGGKASRDKGKRGELQACRALEATLGGVWNRSAAQSRSAAGTPDVVGSDFPGVHIEVKNQAKPNLWAALKQAKGDADGNVPVVLAKRTREEWVVVVELDWLMQLVDEINEGRQA